MSKEKKRGRPEVDDPKVQKSVRIKESIINQMIEDFGGVQKALDEILGSKYGSGSSNESEGD